MNEYEKSVVVTKYAAVNYEQYCLIPLACIYNVSRLCLSLWIKAVRES